MNIFTNLGLILGGSWASGVNLYMTVAGLGILDRMGVIQLPGNLDVISHPLVIALAVLLYLVEFVADKIPFVDSAWDSIHTFIWPAGAAMMAFSGMSETSPPFQMSLAMLAGTVALDSHLTKATTRVAINTSPEPFTNSIASVTEDGLVAVALWLIVAHPIIASILVIAFIVFSIWFLRVMFRFLRSVLRFIFGKSDTRPNPTTTA